MTTGVHRIVESHAATHSNDLAFVEREHTLTYRELNQRGNALARYFIGRGFRRGSRAIVKMGACPDLAVVLLAVLKAGGAYTWLDDRVAKGPDKPAWRGPCQVREARLPPQRAGVRAGDPGEGSPHKSAPDASQQCSSISLEQDEGGEPRHVVVDIREALAASARPAPNLPILTRAADIACVLPPRNGRPGVRVPHAAITALHAHPLPQRVGWSSDPDALDLWRPLMAGATVRLATASEAVA